MGFYSSTECFQKNQEKKDQIYPSTSSASTALTSVMPSDSNRTLEQQDLVDLLGIPEGLTKQVNNPGLRLQYARYKACIAAQHTVLQKVKEGTWPGRKPANQEIIKFFVSKTTWHGYLSPAFSDISDYPLLKDWLEGEEGGPSDEEVWGVSKSNYTFGDLKEEKERRKKARTAKGKKKVRNDDDNGGGSEKGVEVIAAKKLKRRGAK